MFIVDIIKFFLICFIKLALLGCILTAMLGIYIGLKYLFSLRLFNNYKDKDFKTISALKFMPYAKLPTNKDFFKKSLHTNNDIFKTKLPNFNLNDYDFNGVSISNCHFTKNTVLPDDVDFFQKVHNKTITDTIFPSGDYRKYNFDGVFLNRVVFPKDAILPENYSFFKKLSNSYCVQMGVPDSFIECCHLYDLSNINLCLNRKVKISDLQKTIILHKNNNKLYEFIKI